MLRIAINYKRRLIAISFTEPIFLASRFNMSDFLDPVNYIYVYMHAPAVPFRCNDDEQLIYYLNRNNSRKDEQYGQLKGIE